MQIISYISAPTSIIASDNNWDNFNNYIEYLDDVLEKHTKCSEQRLSTSFVSQIFGKINLEIYVHEYIDYFGNTDIRFRITQDEDRFTEDFWLENLPKDEALLEFIETKYTELMNDVKEVLSIIQYPINENLIFKDDHLYMEISPLNPKHTPEYVNLKVETEFYREEFLDNFYYER